MKLVIGLSLLAAASAANVFSINNELDYSSPAKYTGTDQCALINVMMDESGSMKGDQNFMKGKNGVPKIAKAFFDFSNGSVYKHIFVCAQGYGSGSKLPRLHGCAHWTPNNLDTTVMNKWVASGWFEDAWHASVESMHLTPDTIDGVDIYSTCKGVKKQVILVTDEDVDIKHVVYRNTTIVRKMFDHNGFALNVIANVEIKIPNSNEKVLGMSQSAKHSANQADLFVYDTSSSKSYRTLIASNFTLRSKNGKSVDHYYPLISGRVGALWDIGMSRTTTYVDAMSNALADIKLAEANKVPESGPILIVPTVGGDPHFTTWRGEHYEYHGQCDMVLTKDAKFANGAGLDIHLRTKIVRFWSYIKNAAIRIGNDILEVEGSAEPSNTENRYWINFEHQGELKEVGGFPVSVKIQSPVKRVYEIDLDKKYAGFKVIISTYKEFVRVRFEGGDESSLGGTVGLLGDFNTGKTLARDGATVLDDFSELGNEWQVMPSEPKLFHEIDHPQFPEKCIEPEDPRGERRRRRLGENTVTEEQAEAACARLSDAADRKDCVYDILATQDMGMVGAY